MADLNNIKPDNPDETVEEAFFRSMIETEFFDKLDPEDRELFLLEIASQCISWVMARRDY